MHCYRTLRHAEALDVYRNEAGDVNWTVISPLPVLHPGARTGTYRTGTDSILTESYGQGHIWMNDFAGAILDELERPRFVRRRFTVAHDD